jgi:hypothetical protein
VANPYIFHYKTSHLNSLKTISTTSFAQLGYGSVVTGSYPLSSSIVSEFFLLGQDRPYIRALRNTLDYYAIYSDHYRTTSTLGDKITQPLRLVSIPSIFYGSKIEKGTVKCSFYHTGSLIAELTDVHRNGELIQTGPSGSNGFGQVAGVVLYSEGFVILTGSWSLHPTYEDFFNPFDPGNTSSPTWLEFMGSGSEPIQSSSFGLTFEGKQITPTMTIMPRAERGELNHSNNPTYTSFGQTQTILTSSNGFHEKEDVPIVNIVSSSYRGEVPFQKITYINKIGLYDEDRNLIAIAKTATPVRKREEDSYTFKLKLDF